MIAATTRREIFNIVVISMGVDDQSGSQISVHARDPGATLQAQETPFHFNELNEQINEKIHTSNPSG
jgi:hypothetical protein